LLLSANTAHHINTLAAFGWNGFHVLQLSQPRALAGTRRRFASSNVA
jgi:hypothetical protein